MNYTNLHDLLQYRVKYQISLQFWPGDHVAVFIAKDDIDLTDFSGEDAIQRALDYLNRITNKPKF